MHPIESPIRVYADADGEPLEGGYVYFGLPSQNPETSPVTVYWDAAGTIPASQPLRTVNGYIVRGSTPANVYFAGQYSITVRDSRGALIFTLPTADTNPEGYLLSITSSQVTTALGYTPANIAGQNYTGLHKFAIGAGSFESTALNTLHVFGALGAGNGAVMQFERQTPSAFGIKLGLNSSNTFALGGWSQGSDVYRWTSDISGNFVALGNVTAFSDMRFKEEIERLKNVTERLLAMEHGGFTYLDNRTGQRKIGVGAQEVMQAGFGEAVLASDEGHLSVAYGQLALAALVEATRELTDRIDTLEQRINQLERL